VTEAATALGSAPRPLVRLPAYAMRLRSGSARSAAGDTVWLGSEWRTDERDHLGGERSVWTYIHAVAGRSADQAARWTALYWRVRDATGWPVTIERVPAALLHDVRQHATLFDRLGHASWCVACHGAPALPAHWLCWWCAAAPVAALYADAPGPEWIA
jgi:hypothetical protein